MIASPVTSVAEPSIVISQLAKEFGTVRALADVSLQVHPGEIYVLLGANGAGKSTLMRILLGYLNPTHGSATTLGGSSRETPIRARVGYLPGDLRLAARSTVAEILGFRSRMQLHADRPAVDAEEFCERLDIPVERRFGTLSKGNRQKVGLALALMSAPDVLVLDEPTSGLDPIMQESVLDIIRERRDAGAAVLLSTHILSEAADVADRVGVLSKGSLVMEAPLSTFLEQARQSLVVTLDRPAPPDLLDDVDEIADVHIADRQVTLVVVGSTAETVRRLAPYGVRRIATQPHELDEMFQQVMAP